MSPKTRLASTDDLVGNKEGEADAQQTLAAVVVCGGCTIAQHGGAASMAVTTAHRCTRALDGGLASAVGGGSILMNLRVITHGTSVLSFIL